MHNSLIDCKLSDTQIPEFPKINNRLEGDTGAGTTKSEKVKNTGGGTKGMRMGENKTKYFECWQCRIPYRNSGLSAPLQPGKVQMARQADGQVWE